MEIDEVEFERIVRVKATLKDVNEEYMKAYMEGFTIAVRLMNASQEKIQVTSQLSFAEKNIATIEIKNKDSVESED